jgi:hypothetical protein
VNKAAVGGRQCASPHLQRILERVHACRPRPIGELLVELLEHAEADPCVLDRLGAWARLGPDLVRRLGVDRFPRPPLDLVPREDE